MNAPALFPVFLKLEGRNCLVIGGGTVGETKVQSLLSAGARVTLVAPQITSVLREHAKNGLIAWRARRFELSDLEGVVLSIAATQDDHLNQLIYDESDRRGILCNAVDQPHRCHFYFPAVVRRGALQIAISTGGLSPSLAKRLRQELEQQFGPEYEAWLEWLGSIRVALMNAGLSFEHRKDLLAKFASAEVLTTLPALNAESLEPGVSV
jgi:precorrin-2 dehydrogenase/sirohydrochlorin ferrochelatase